MEQDIHQYYETHHPGEVVVLGADLFNCPPASLGGFQENTGATFPLLMLAAVSTGGNIETLYGERDHYVVINKQGIVRYQANDRWAYGNGYHLNEIRACVDSLVSSPVGLHRRPLVRQPARRPRQEPPHPATSEPEETAGAALRIGQSPSGSTVTIVLASSTAAARARVTVLDLAGRRLATLLEGTLTPGERTLIWDGRDPEGRAAPPGVYQVRAEIAGTVLSRRIALVR